MHETVFDIGEIQEIIPHRYPFLLVDRVIEFVDSERIVAIKNVTANEPFFTGHFPGRPVMPGVMMMEALAQTSAILAKKSTMGTKVDTTIFLVGCKNFKWKRMVYPGDTLYMHVDFIKRKSRLWMVDCRALVDGEVVAEGSISAMETD
ncbi:MAG: 3-hydroxyacyl-ACP dehydratase FabZ [Bdellovibrionales bacterium]|nr:3-hydroxyacyl-ACP dehydratase FabZ [Bdellovibrionales bacterium]